MVILMNHRTSPTIPHTTKTNVCCLKIGRTVGKKLKDRWNDDASSDSTIIIIVAECN